MSPPQALEPRGRMKRLRKVPDVFLGKAGTPGLCLCVVPSVSWTRQWAYIRLCVPHSPRLMGANGFLTRSVAWLSPQWQVAVVVFSEQVFSGKWPQSQLPKGSVLCFTAGLHEWCPLVCKHSQESVTPLHPPGPQLRSEARAVVSF